MSFILDSLRKSEHARQQTTGPSIADVRTSNDQKNNKSMIYWLAGLLAINALVLVMAIWRPWNNDTQTTVEVIQPKPVAAVRETLEHAVPSESRSEVRSLAREVRAPKTAVKTAPSKTNDSVPKVSSAPIEKNLGEDLPSIYQLQSSGDLKISDLHLDMHMFHDTPSRRFVFINSKKYKEGEKISEGPLLEEIRNDSVVFYHQGQRFLLPRN